MTVFKDIANTVSSVHGLSKVDGEAIVRLVLDEIREGLEGDGEVFLSGFGKFKVEQRPARQGRNPQNGEVIEIPAKNAIKFKPAKALDEFLN